MRLLLHIFGLTFTHLNYPPSSIFHIQVSWLSVGTDKGLDKSYIKAPCLKCACMMHTPTHTQGAGGLQALFKNVIPTAPVVILQNS